MGINRISGTVLTGEERKILTPESSLDDVIDRSEAVISLQTSDTAFAEIACALLILAREIKELKWNSGTPLNPKLFNHGPLNRLIEESKKHDLQWPFWA